MFQVGTYTLICAFSPILVSSVYLGCRASYNFIAHIMCVCKCALLSSLGFTNKIISLIGHVLQILMLIKHSLFDH